jgi:uncharacterized protein (TIGR03083 family)
MTLPVIHTKHLFPTLDQQLINLLRHLSAADWKLSTRAKMWTVKDIATHLLDGNLRTLSFSRDQYFGNAAHDIDSHQALVSYLNQLNADWVKATNRLSPMVLIELLETTGKQYCEHIQSLDLHSPAVFSVGWAGELESENWFHIAREYTEKWHHQQQIREAVGKPGIESLALYKPVLETFMRALPYHFGKIETARGTCVAVRITGEAGGLWHIVKKDTWRFSEPTDHIAVSITIHQDHAWKLLTKGLTFDEAESLAQITGDVPLGVHFLTMLSVMA